RPRTQRRIQNQAVSFKPQGASCKQQASSCKLNQIITGAAYRLSCSEGATREPFLESLRQGSGALCAGRAAQAGQPGQAEHQREPLRSVAEGDRGHPCPVG